MLSFWTLLLSRAGALSDGTFTVVSKASGHRMFASAKDGLYVVDDSGPIYHDQMWLFALQDNDSYAIVNAANGMRVLAQSAANGDDGFFAVDNGPIYQDQRWRLSQQIDGSYAIENVKSDRRLLTRMGTDGVRRFGAIASSGPARTDETWWLINQERDETARVAAELHAEKGRVAKLEEEAAVAKNASAELMLRLQNAVDLERQLRHESESWKNRSSGAMTALQEEQSSKAMLAKDVESHQNKLEHLQSALLSEKTQNERLVLEVRTHGDEQRQQEVELAGALAAKNKLTQAIKVSSSKSASLALELQTVKTAKARLLESVSGMRNQVATLKLQLHAATESNAELLLRMSSFEMQPECHWMSGVELDMGSQVLVAVLVIALVATIASCGRRHVGLVSKVQVQSKRISMLEQELHAEFGDMVSIGDSDNGLGSDFGFCVFNTEINQEIVRLIKVQCPGVKHSDVEIELIFNGCEVTIERQASRGVASTTWKRRFQFKPSDGLFEFREEQMMLEDGFLQLVFHACGFQNRRVLFPRHFNLSESDADACWDYSVDIDMDRRDEADAWWNEPERPGPGLAACIENAGKACLVADADTESTASTARVLA